MATGNMHRVLETDAMDVLGYEDRVEYRNEQKIAKKFNEDSEKNFDLIKKAIEEYILKIVVETKSIPVVKNESYIEGVLIIRVVINGDKKRILTLGAGLNIRLFENEQINLFDLSDIIRVQFVTISDFLNQTVSGILLLKNIQCIKTEEFIDEGVLVLDYYLNTDKEVCSSLEDEFDIMAHDGGLKLENIAEVNFFTKDEKHEEETFVKGDQTVVPADDLLNSIQETIKRIEDE